MTRLKTPALVGLAVGACLLSGATGATAAQLITGADVADGSLTGADLREDSVGLRALRPSVFRRLVDDAVGLLPEGVPGATGPQGERGPAGEAGPQGVPGPSGARGPQGVAGPEGPTGSGGVSGHRVVQTYFATSINGGAIGVDEFSATCPTGQRLLSGGWLGENDFDQVLVRQSWPDVSDRAAERWRLYLQPVAGASDGATISGTVFAVCADGEPAPGGCFRQSPAGQEAVARRC